jgi:hypothetical protein
LFLSEVPADTELLKRTPAIRIYVPAEQTGKWSSTGIAVNSSASLKDYVAVPPPRIRMQTAVSAATALPWVDSNGWRIERGAHKILYSKLPEKSAAVAAAEAFVFGADAVLEPSAADIPTVLQMLSFLAAVDQPAKPVLANIGLVDNGAPELPEIMNLLARRNLMYRVVRQPDKSLDLNVEIGSRDFPAQEAKNPYELAQKIRAKLGDDKRTLRLFNSSTVLGRVTADSSGTRVHLLNYGTRPVSWVQVRVRGKYAPGRLRAFGAPDAALADFAIRDGGTEFTVPVLNAYAVIDLPPASKALLISSPAPATLGLTADPESAAWRAAAPVVIDTDYNGNPVQGYRTEVRSLWTPEALHVLFTNTSQELNLKPNPNLQAETPRLWDWDVSEMFLGSDAARIASYKEFQVSPQGEWLDLDIDRADPKAQAGAKWNSGMQVRARVDSASNTWYGEFRIPFKDLGISTPKAGSQLRAGLFRIAGRAPNRRYLSWQVTNGKTFHVPENFGTIELGSR